MSAEMIPTTAARKLPTTAGTKGRLQIMYLRKAVGTDHLALTGQTSPAEIAAARENQLHTALPPLFPRNHWNNKARQEIKEGNRILLKNRYKITKIFQCYSYF
jgi:hypothetical protein